MTKDNKMTKKGKKFVLISSFIAIIFMYLSFIIGETGFEEIVIYILFSLLYIEFCKLFIGGSK